MQREPRYRAYDKRTKFMTDIQGFKYAGDKHIQLYYLDADGDSTTCTCEKEFIELQEYTGVNDKNGKEIYEGDILDLTYFLTKNKGIVKFGKYKQCDMSNDYECGNQGFYVDVQNDKHDTYRHDIYFYAGKSEVIGNIYQNPELLQEVEQ